MLSRLYTSLGSHLLAKAMRTTTKDETDVLLAKALYWLEQGNNHSWSQWSAKLKLATFHYMIGNSWKLDMN